MAPVAAPGMRFSGLPWHQGEEEVEQVPAEILYQGLLPSLPQYMVSWGALGFPRALLCPSGADLGGPHPGASLHCSVPVQWCPLGFLPSAHMQPCYSLLWWGGGPVAGPPVPIRFSVSPFSPDRSAEDPPCRSPHLQSQDGLHQYPGRRLAGGDAVSDHGGGPEAAGDDGSQAEWCGLGWGCSEASWLILVFCSVVCQEFCVAAGAGCRWLLRAQGLAGLSS